MKRNFNATVWQEGEWFVAQCLEVDVTSQGATEAEVIAALKPDADDDRAIAGLLRAKGLR